MSKERDQYKQGIISKQVYIDRMFGMHSTLFYYPAIIAETDISEITIREDGVVFTTEQEGIKLFCTKPDKRTAPFEIMNFGKYEAGDADMLLSLISEADTVFDIGANIGWYSMLMTKKKQGVQVYSFEPVPATFSALQKNLLLNNTDRVTAFNHGFSNTDTILSFYSSADTSVSSSSVNITGEENPVMTQCTVKRLDDFCSENSIFPDVIKCDVEGAELLVFQGGINMMAEKKPAIFTEMLRKWAARFDYHPNDIIALLGSAGYSCFVNDGPGKLKRIDTVTDETVETNFCFLHPGKHEALINTHAS